MLRMRMFLMFGVLLAISALNAQQPQEAATADLTLKVNPRFRNAPLQFDAVSLISSAGDSLSSPALPFSSRRCG